MKCITHIVLYQILKKLHEDHVNLMEQQRLRKKMLMGCFLMQTVFTFSMKKRGEDQVTRMRRKIHHLLSFAHVPQKLAGE